MFSIFRKYRETQAVLLALDKSQAIIEFQTDGTIITANRNFLDAIGYTLAEIRGKHHSMFVEPAYRDSQDYAEFWRKLRSGEFQRAQFKRIGKNGREIWLEASYNPVLGSDGAPFKVVKYATDVTKLKTEYADLLGKVNAVNRSQAVIEFEMDGTILTANQTFLKAMGYTLPEIQGKHHRIFLEPAYRDSQDYKDFLAKLNRGEYQEGQFKRLGKGGREVWIQGAYNPTFDLNGKPFKIVKFATDITQQVTLLANLKTLIDENFAELENGVHHSNSQVTSVTSAVAETSNDVQTVAASAEELSASINEISGSMSRSQTATDSAFAQVTAAGQSTRRLADAATAMGGIISLIQNIAGQINLLALNATIESARAGDAGKGFAVVANEVKNLASQAAKATEQISQEIENVQSISGEVVSALGTINTSIDVVRGHVATTASAVEEQSAVTKNLSSTMQRTATSVDGIARNISGIAATIQQAGTTVTKTKEAAQVLAR